MNESMNEFGSLPPRGGDHGCLARWSQQTDWTGFNPELQCRVTLIKKRWPNNTEIYSGHDYHNWMVGYKWPKETDTHNLIYDWPLHFGETQLIQVFTGRWNELHWMGRGDPSKAFLNPIRCFFFTLLRVLCVLQNVWKWSASLIMVKCYIGKISGE